MYYCWVRDSGVARQGLSWGCSQMLAGLSSFEGSTRDSESTPCGPTCGCKLMPVVGGKTFFFTWASPWGCLTVLTHDSWFPQNKKHSRKQDWSCIAFHDLTKEITRCYFCHFLLVTVVSRIMIPQKCPKAVELIFYGKGEFTALVKLGFWDRQIVLDYPGGSNVITSVVISKIGKQER